MNKKIDPICTEQIVCPHCGYKEYVYSWECEEGERECEKCGQLSNLEMTVTV